MDTQLILNQLFVLPEQEKKEALNFIKFLVEKTKREKKVVAKKPKFGSNKKLFIMSDDFNEPLEDFKEYMP